MNTVLRFDKVVLVKELNERFKKVGEVFEIANILENSFLLRSPETKVALGIISFEDFENCFVSAEKFKGWTPWTQFIGFDGQNDISYRTNGKKVQVRSLTDKVRGEACRNKNDDFSLSFGIRAAYLRCLNKSLAKQKAEYAEKIKMIDRELAENETILKKMINSLD